jgi:hypothetical protein
VKEEGTYGGGRKERRQGEKGESGRQKGVKGREGVRRGGNE